MKGKMVGGCWGGSWEMGKKWGLVGETVEGHGGRDGGELGGIQWGDMVRG